VRPGDRRRGGDVRSGAGQMRRGEEGNEKQIDKKKKRWDPHLEGIWRASRNRGLEGKFGGPCKMEVRLEKPC
jgi:hypothetical protein